MDAGILDWSQCPELESVPGKMSGALVFKGTRVPPSAILGNLESLSIDEVVAEFPSVTKVQVQGLLEFLAQSADAASMH